jgi:hypothetical protein
MEHTKNTYLRLRNPILGAHVAGETDIGNYPLFDVEAASTPVTACDSP